MDNFKSFLPVVKEWTLALTKLYTYNPRKNYYFLFGMLWGIPVPIVTIGMALYYHHKHFFPHAILTEISINPSQYFFLLHPILFGIVFGAMGTVRDDKERQRRDFEEKILSINKELKEKNEKLQELDTMKDNFLSMVSHELWTPLTTVEGYVTLMKRGKVGQITEKQKEILEIVDGQIEHLNHLIEELIDISKIEAGKFEVKLDSLDIRDVTGNVINSFNQLALDKNITLSNTFPSCLSFIWGDRKRLIQVFHNILGNAVKFTPSGGKITLSAKEKDSMVEVSVADTGIGITKDKIDKIFDKFYQVDSTHNREYGGCGLGLTITKSIMELHGGKIWVESEKNAGSRFFLEFRKYSEKE